MPTKTTVAKTRRSRAPRRKKKSGGLFRRFPWWGLLVGCVLVVVAYIVILYHFFVGPLSFRWRAIYGEPDYPDGYEVHGIDISHYQKNIDWEKLRNAKVNDRPLSFVIVKATEGLTLVDENFNDNFYRVRKNDLIRGAYHFYNPAREPIRQAEFYLKQVHLEPGDLPPILDVEKRGRKSLSEFQHDVKTWLDVVQTVYGVAPIIYTNLDFKKRYLNEPVFDEYPLWVANYYKKKLSYEGNWVIWQYTDWGKVDGINDKVDFNLFNGDMAEFRDMLIPDEVDTTLKTP